MGREFTVVIERDQDECYVASVPELLGCHTQGKTLGEVLERIQEAILLCLEVQGRGSEGETRFAGVLPIVV